MSKRFEELKRKYNLKYITIDQLRRWVVIDQKSPGNGITAEEFEAITGIKYQ